MDEARDETVALLDRWAEGDKSALQTLVAQNLDWVNQKVRSRLGGKLRRIGDTQDFVQEAMLDFLKYSPRLRVANLGQFRALLARVIESAITDQNNRWFRARRRALSRELPLSSDTVLDLAPGRRSHTPPEDRASKEEFSALLRLGVEMLAPKDRQVIVLRFWDGMEFAELGEEIGISAEAARKRFKRALQKLRDQLVAIRRGLVEA